MHKHYDILDLQCWIGVDHLGEEILDGLIFTDIWDLHPEEKSTILMYGTKISAHRYLQSYGCTPLPSAKSSYMFSLDYKPTPEVFKGMLEHMNATFLYDYNQIVVNWYKDANDYVPFHCDWSPDKSVSFPVTLCEPEGVRQLTIKS